MASSATVQMAPTALAASGNDVAPNSVNNLDCNSWSTRYTSARPAMKELCTDPISIVNGKASRFIDNGWYVGHDEPSVKFISSAQGSGNQMTYFMTLAIDPKAAPTTSPTGQTVADYAELSPAPWFGLPICDPRSYPQNPCAPDSDSNSSGINDPRAAGSAFMELQFYPPGFTPWIDGPSCDASHYCAALNIDSLECTFGFASCNSACIEPVNFAFLQRNGVPAGPPSPQLTNLSTFTPNSETLLMNQGDRLVVTIRDTRDGLMTSVGDLSTHQSGYMVASAANGFMDTSINNCHGRPFSFHPEYNTAQQRNQVPWAALEGGVLMEDELGHFEPCSSVSNSFPVGGGSAFSDPQVYQTCNGGFEANGVGESCDLSTGQCTGTTEGDQPCPSTDPASGAVCEWSDAFCMPAGPRPVTINGVTRNVSWPVAGCQDNVFQNGDTDFDGSSYIADWPDGSPSHPTSFSYSGPFDANGHLYPQIQFETDVGGSETFCNTNTGVGCTAPPLGPGNAPTFYPFWTIGRSGRTGACVWNFGNRITGQTTQSFGGPAEYGAPNIARYGGTLASAVLANPQLGRGCGVAG
ncbi:MAG TPA: hypothetical protein VF725_02010 [Ktedonobacterales bacterium]